MMKKKVIKRTSCMGCDVGSCDETCSIFNDYCDSHYDNKRMMIYKTSDGKEIPYDDAKINQNKCFKVNLPFSMEDARTGNGEGVWGCTTDINYKKIDNKESGIYLVKILNDSVYYPKLRYGTIVLCKYNGIGRPIALKTELDFYYESISIEEKENIIQEVLAYIKELKCSHLK